VGRVAKNMPGFCSIRSLENKPKLLNYFWFVFIFRLISLGCVSYSLFYPHWGHFTVSGTINSVSGDYESAYGLFFLWYNCNIYTTGESNQQLSTQFWGEINNILGKVRTCQCFAVIAFLLKFLGVIIMPLSGAYAVTSKELLPMLTQSFYLFIGFICSAIIVLITWSTIPTSDFATVFGPASIDDDFAIDDDEGEVPGNVAANYINNFCDKTANIANIAITCQPTGKASSFIFTIIMVIVVLGLIYSSKTFSRLLKEDINEDEISTGLTNSQSKSSDFSHRDSSNIQADPNQL